ncbi:MAG: hypothetical protein HQ446_06245 [Polaromonas sp.]|nr:hypothetical protein [Polaromonas sp.]
MTTYEVFFADVLPHVPGCPPEMALREIRSTVIEFCEKSLIHQITPDSLTIRAGVQDYDLDAPAGHRVHKIMKAWFKGQPLTPMAPDEIDTPDLYSARIPGYTPTKSDPVAYTQKDYSTVSFLPIADQTHSSAITMRVALAPLRSSTQCEDFLFEQWGEYLSCGAKARLMLTPGKPYTNTDSAVVNQGRYMTALNDARQRAIRGNVRSSLRVQLRMP